MPLTATDYADINRRAVERAHELTSDLIRPDGGPNSLARQINPNAAGVCYRPRIVDPMGGWSDLEGGARYCETKHDLIGLVEWMASVDRETAALALDDYLRRLGSPPQPIARDPAQRHRPADPPPERKPAPPRSLRRVG